MNTEKAQTIINKIVADYRSENPVHARTQYPASKKYILLAEELGILELIPNAPHSNHIGNTEIQLILKAAEDAGSQVGGIVDGEGDVINVDASELYKALNEVEVVEEIADVETQTIAINETSIDFWQDGNKWFYCVYDSNSESEDIGGFETFEDAKASAFDYVGYVAASPEEVEQGQDTEIAKRIEEVYNTMSASEAEQAFNLSSGTIRQACNRNQFKTQRKSGGTWLIHRAELENLYRQ